MRTARVVISRCTDPYRSQIASSIPVKMSVERNLRAILSLTFALLQLDLNRYQRAELLASDHRPVYAILRARIRTIDHVKRGALRKALLADVAAQSPLVEMSTRLSKVLDAHDPTELPPPSDDSKSWWENGSGECGGVQSKIGLNSCIIADLPVEQQLSDAVESTTNPFLAEEISAPPVVTAAIRTLRPPPPAHTHNVTLPASASVPATTLLKRKLPPLASIPTSTSDGSLIGLDDLAPERVMPVVPPRPSNPSASLLDDEEDESSEAKKYESIR